VGQLDHSAPVCVHDEDFFVTVSGAKERDVLAIGRPDWAVIDDAIIVRELRDIAPVRVITKISKSPPARVLLNTIRLPSGDHPVRSPPSKAGLSVS
jgi:hypothetical protein